MLRAEIDRIVEESSRRLYQISIPPVRCWLLDGVLCKDREDSVMQKALAETERYPPRVKLLSTLREDGTWPISKQRKAEEGKGPGSPFGWTSTTAIRNLYMLYEYFTPPGTGHMDVALENILRWQHDDGYIMGPEPDMLPRPAHNGLALCVLYRFKKGSDPRVGKIIRWLLENQRYDGGWSIPYIQDARYLPEYRYMGMPEFIRKVQAGKVPKCSAEESKNIPSCIWSTLGVLRGLNWSETHRQSRNVMRGGDFILDHFFKRNYHSSFYHSEKNWTMLKFPVYNGSGLTAIDCLEYMGFGPDDPRMEKPIRWLMSMRHGDGFWYRSVRPHNIDDQWITVTALMVLAYYSRMY